MTLRRSPTNWTLALWLMAWGCAAESSRNVTARSPELTDTERERARALFAGNCALCHGDQGDGRGVRRAGFTRPPRDFTNPVWSRSTAPDTVRDIIREGRHGTPMPAFSALTAEEVDLLSRYVLSLGRPPHPRGTP